MAVTPLWANTEFAIRYRWALLVVLAGNMLIDALDGSAMLVAAPSIGRELELGQFGTQWLISGFALGMGALVPFGGWVVARLGRRRVFLAALLVFALASALAGVVGNAELLIVTRVVKGLCAALTAPIGLAIISTALPAGEERDRAVSVYTLAGAGGFSTGLVISGLFCESSWRWAVAFPAPLVLVLFLAAMRLVPGDAVGDDSATHRGYEIAGPLRRALSNGGLVRSALGAAALNGSFTGFLFIATRQLQDDLGWGPLHTALAFLPASVPLAVTALHSGRMVRRFGAVRLIAIGALPPVLGYALLIWQVPPPSYLVGLLPTLLLVAVGFVLSFTALNTQATADVLVADRAVAGGVYQASVQAGAVSVLIAVATVLTIGAGSVRGPLIVIAAVAALGLIVGLSGLSEGLSPSARKSDPSS